MSGGRCPSAKVLMLMITFSPISTRPSSVADPMAAAGQHFPIPQAWVNVGAVFINIQSCTCQFVGAQHARQCIFIMTSPRDVFTITALGFNNRRRRAFIK